MSGNSVTRHGMVAFREMGTMGKLHTTTENHKASHTKGKSRITIGHATGSGATKSNEQKFPNISGANYFPPRTLSLLDY